jgi:hypothetical protein
MAHRPEDVESQSILGEVRTATVWISDLEPVLGLIAALGRFNSALTREALAALPATAVEALSDIQGIMWRLEHARVDLPSEDGG